jgi:hypothetical protein
LLAAAVLVLAALGCGGGSGPDLLIDRAGRVERGVLDGCGVERCTFAGAPRPRATIVWLGLGVEHATPPALGDPMHDEVHLVTGSVERVRVLSIDSDRLTAAGATFPRREVTWVYLAGGGVPPEGEEVSGSRAAAGCWQGVLRGRSTESGPAGYSTEHEFSVEYRLREQLETEGEGVRFVTLVHEGSILRDRFVNRGPDYVCRGGGSVRPTGQDGAIIHNDGRRALAQLGCQVEPGAGIYDLGFSGEGQAMAQHCEGLEGEPPAALPFPNLGVVDPELTSGSCRAFFLDDGRTRMVGRSRYGNSSKSVSLEWDLRRSPGPCSPLAAD